MTEQTTSAVEQARVVDIAKYPLRRDLMASVRLYVQYWMWKREMGYVLYPHIQVKDGAKVADVGCGTGMWLIDVARQYPNVQCDGFDISTEQFPVKGWLPKNVDLKSLDMLQPIPDHLRGQFDVVRVGNLVVVLPADDPTATLENLKLMLKPGGYLQWDESDFGNLLVSSPHPNTSHSALDEVGKRVHDFLFAANGKRYQWVRSLSTYFEKSKLTVLDDRTVIPGDDIALPWTLQHLMATREFIQNLDNPLGSASAWWELYDRAMYETHLGASMRMALVSCVGKKS